MYFHKTNLVFTREGYKSLEELVDIPTEIWNGFEWIKVLPVLTDQEKEFYQHPLSINYPDGSIKYTSFICTEETLFFCFSEHLCRYELLTFPEMEERNKAPKGYKTYSISLGYTYEPGSTEVYYTPEFKFSKQFINKDYSICLITSNKFVLVNGILLTSFSKYNNIEHIHFKKEN